jgi:hypothetical protein
MDIQKIEQATNSLFTTEHSCTANPQPAELKLLLCESTEGIPQNQWQFHIMQVAKSADVGAGEAGFVGELISQSMVAVSFCPFCGAKLSHSGV